MRGAFRAALIFSLADREAYPGTGERTEPRRRLRRALTDIAACHLEYKRPDAENPAARL